MPQDFVKYLVAAVFGGGLVGALAGAFFYLTNVLCYFANFPSNVACVTNESAIIESAGIGALIGIVMGPVIRNVLTSPRIQQVADSFGKNVTPWIVGLGFASFAVFMGVWLVWMLRYVANFQTQFILYINAPIFTIEGIILALTPQMKNRTLRAVDVLLLLFALIFSIMTFGDGSPSFFFWTTALFGFSVTVYGLDSLLQHGRQKAPIQD